MRLLRTDPMSSSDSHAAIVKRLRERFAEFRRNHAPRSRIPESLQRAVADAVSGGVPVSVVCRTCRVSAGQVQRWRATADLGGGGNGGELAPPRVLSVVPGGGTTCDACVEFSVSVGSWRMSVRLNPTTAE